MNFLEPKENRTLLIPPDRQSAQIILDRWKRLKGHKGTKYYLGTILFQIPVIVSDDAGAIAEAAVGCTAFDDVQCFTAPYDSDYPFMIICRKDGPEVWFTEFDNFNMAEFRRDFLMFYSYLKDIFHNRTFRLDDMPSPREWEAIRLAFYVRTRTIPVFPRFYPAYLNLYPMPPDFQQLVAATTAVVKAKRTGAKNPWTGEEAVANVLDGVSKCSPDV